MSTLEIRRARPGDAAAIAGVISAGFEPVLLDAMIYGCRGIAGYIEAALATPYVLADRRFTVASLDGLVVGCVELRRAGTSVVLNCIAVAPELRGRQVGAALLQRALVDGEHSHDALLLLDVFQHNSVAAGWYERLGFVDTGGSEWWETPLLPPSEPLQPVTIVLDLPQADASQSLFGFSQFRVMCGDTVLHVGRLGTTWFRVTDAAAADHGQLHAILGALEPTRRLLAVLPVGGLPESRQRGSRLVARTRRLACPIGVVGRKLADPTSFLVPATQ